MIDSIFTWRRGRRTRLRRTTAALTAAVALAWPPPSAAREHVLTAGETLIAVEVDRGDVIRFRRCDGQVRTFELVTTAARVLFSTLKEPKKGQAGGGTIYEMTCTLRADGQPLELRRYVCTQEAFYEPYVINGVRLWFDAVADITDFLNFSHGDCRPNRHARFALQDATQRICPDELLPWYPNPARFISIGDTNDGDDCWLGAFSGADAHGGLDINQPAGTLNYAPLAFDDHFLFESLAAGHDNNRWRGIRRWPNGDTWMLQTHHLLALLVPEHAPLTAGEPFCTAAGVKYGTHEHSHYAFKIQPARNGPIVDLDPWIVFWQIFEDQKRRAGELDAAMAPLAPVRAGDPVTFDARASRAGPARKILRAEWSFGDGGGAVGVSASHVFAAPGVFPVTLTIADGSHLATCTQHLTVNGVPSPTPVLAWRAPDEPSFRVRPRDAMDVYGRAPARMPHTLEFIARAQRPRPRPRSVQLANLGGGELPRAAVRVAYSEGRGWLRADLEGVGNRQTVRVVADATGLAGGRYTARVEVEVPGTGNGRQSLGVALLVPTHPAMPPVSRRVQQPLEKVVDDTSPGFYATPWFWVGHRFTRAPQGHRGFHLLNGGRPREGEFVRFAPDLAASLYEVRLAAETPFAAEARFAVRVRHAAGEETVWLEPARSRVVGTFPFDDGDDGFVEILAAGSTGQVLADAVIFKRVRATAPAASQP